MSVCERLCMCARSDDDDFFYLFLQKQKLSSASVIERVSARVLCVHVQCDCECDHTVWLGVSE